MEQCQGEGLGDSVTIRWFALFAGTPLTEYISHYEPLNYDIQQLQQAHHRAKRSADHEVQLRFSAHGRLVGPFPLTFT